METLVFDILILLEMVWHQTQTGIVALMQHSRVVLWTKSAIYIYIYIGLVHIARLFPCAVKQKRSSIDSILYKFS